MAYRPFSDFWLKGAAVALAVMLWLSVGGEPVVERGLDVPLQFVNVPDGLEIVDDPPNTVRVQVRGSSSVVSRLGPGEIVAVLDLVDERAGQRLFDMFAQRVVVPPGVEVINVVPGAVTLTLERAGPARTVPVVPNIEGAPADGFTVGRITTTPVTVDVLGPENRLSTLREALTETVSIVGATATLVADVTVGVADPTLRLAEPSTARVEIEIVPAQVEQTIHDVPLNWRDSAGAQRASSVQPDHVNVGVRGARESMRDVDTDAVQPFIDLSVLAGRPAGRYNLPVSVETTDSLRVTHIDPPNVQVVVR
jgi:YbbR domain-containing protein